MNLDNLQVKHKVFGLGTVVASDGKYMTIRFDGVDKNFVYPDSFEKYLTLADGTVSEEIREDLARVSAVKQSIIDKKLEENLHSMKHGIVIPGKEMSLENEDEDSQFKSADNDEI
jgi:cobalamin biosynthesis protein CobT